MTRPDGLPDDSEFAEPTRGGLPRWLRWGVLGLVAAVVLFYGAIFLYAKVINDSEEAFTEADLESILTGTTVAVGEAVTVPPATVAAGSPATTVAATPTPESSPAGAGSWVVDDGSELGYRVKEVLFGVDTFGVGRTTTIDGTMTIDGTAVTAVDFVVDVATIKSDDGRRDGQFAGAIMSTSEFPTATFTLTAPIELGTEPVEGASVTATATGDLTLRGVTNSVTFEVTAQMTNGRIGVLGSIDVAFADYEIANPSTGGITTEDHGLIEFVLVFAPATT